MDEIRNYTAFHGSTRLASGPLAEVALKAKAAIDADETARILIFDDANAAQIEVDFRGGPEDVLGRLEPVPPREPEGAPATPADTPRSRGRPKLGVVAREVTLLPRHWEWLQSHAGGASVTLRKLVEAARRANAGEDQSRRARDAAYGFMTVMAGDEPGFEEATRALFATNEARFQTESEVWPADVRDYARELAGPVFAD